MVPYPRISLRNPIIPPPSIIILAFIKPIPSTYHSVIIFFELEEPSTTDSNFIASKVPAFVIINSLFRTLPEILTLLVPLFEYSSPSHFHSRPVGKGRGNRNKGLLYVKVSSFFINKSTLRY